MAKLLTKDEARRIAADWRSCRNCCEMPTLIWTNANPARIQGLLLITGFLASRGWQSRHRAGRSLQVPNHPAAA